MNKSLNFNFESGHNNNKPAFSPK